MLKYTILSVCFFAIPLYADCDLSLPDGAFTREVVEPPLLSPYQPPCAWDSHVAARLEDHCLKEGADQYSQLMAEAGHPVGRKDRLECSGIQRHYVAETQQRCLTIINSPSPFTNIGRGGTWGHTELWDSGGFFTINIVHKRELLWQEIEKEKCLKVKGCFARTSSAEEALSIVALRDKLSCKEFLENEKGRLPRLKIDPMPTYWSDLNRRYPGAEVMVRYN